MTKEIRKFKTLQIFTIYLRYLIGFAWVFNSTVKIKGDRFVTAGGADEPINSAWHMFETLYQSGTFWQFIGWSQLIVGALLFTQRFSLVGAIFSLPIAANIFFITISYYFAGTPVVTGLILLGNIYLILWDWDKFKILFEPKTFTYSPPDSTMIYDKSWIYLGIFYCVFTVILREFLFQGKGIVLVSLSFIVIGIAMLIFNSIRLKK